MMLYNTETMKSEKFYPDFAHSCDDIIKYLKAAGIFTMKLKNGEIIHHMPKDDKDFERWLRKHHVTDMRASSR